MKYVLPILILVLCGCTGKPPSRQDYLLRPELSVVPVEGDTAVRLSKVDVAPYLDRDGIVLATADSAIHAGKQHIWAEPLDQSIVRYLQVAIGAAAHRTVEVSPLTTPGSAMEIAVRIHQLHGTVDGRVRLVAEWSVTNNQGSVRLFQFDSTVRQITDGYPALVDAHGTLLDELASAIADGLD